MSELVAAARAATDGDPAARAALPTLIADLLAGRSLEHSWPRAAVRSFMAAAAAAADLPLDAVSAHVHAHAARDPRLLQLSPQLAVEAQLRMLYAVAPVEHVALWAGGRAAPNCLLSLGKRETARSSRLAAHVAFERGSAKPPAGLSAVPVERWQQVEAALVLRASAENREAAVAAARVTAKALAPVLEREGLLARNAARERALVESGERLLTRVGFDLHDGPIQDLAVLAGELRLVARLLGDAVPDGEARAEVDAALANLEAKVFAADRGLREVVHSLESPNLGPRSLRDVLELELSTFAAQSGIQADLTMSGEFADLTASQRIAIVRIIQEALANVREHSGAEKVLVRVAARSGRISAEVRDDGSGFDVERMLVRAARGGRYGLLGMSERVRLLGGTFDLMSRPNGPTVVSVVLPAWRPLVAENEAEAVP